MSVQTDALRKYFYANGIKIKDVAEKLGVNPSAVSNMLADRDKIGKIRARNLADVYGFDYVFLVTGEGSLFAPKGIHQDVHVDNNSGTITQSASIEPERKSNCPSVSDLMQQLSEMTAKLDAKEAENTWLRGMVERLSGAGK